MNISGYLGKFQFDIIDLEITKIFKIIRKEINNNTIDSKNFNEVFYFIYN